MDDDVNERTSLVKRAHHSENSPHSSSQRRTRVKWKDQRWRKFILIPVLFCKMFSIGIYMFAVPEYVHDVLEESLQVNDTEKYKFKPCDFNKSDPRYIQYKSVQTKTSEWGVYFALASLLPALFANIVWGTYSDVFGRRKVFIICMSGQAVKLVGFTFVLYFKSSFVYLILCLVIDGLSGSFSTLWAVTFSYLSDLTSAGKQRSSFLVVTEVMMRITLTVSVVVSGFMFKSIGYLYPMIVSSIISVIGVLLALFVLPESLDSDILIRAENRSFLKTISSAARLYMKQEPRVNQLKYILLILIFAFFAIPNIGRGNVEAVYQFGEPLCWDQANIGLYGGLKIGLGSVAGLLGIYLLHKVCADDTIALLGMISAMAAYTVEGLARTSTVMYTVSAIGALSTTTTAMIRSVMSSLTTDDKQGALFASVAFVETLCTLLGALTTNFVYQATLTVFAGFVFILCAIITFVGVLIQIVYMYVQRRYISEPVQDRHTAADADNDPDPVVI